MGKFQGISDSGQRQTFTTGMVRDTEDGKPRFDLMLPRGIRFEDQMLTRLAQHYAHGAVKYSDRNWEKAETQEELDRYYSSGFRHFVQWLTGMENEDHAAAVIFNIIAAETVKVKLKRAAADGTKE